MADILQRIQSLKQTIEDKAGEKQRLLGKQDQLKTTMKALIGSDDVDKAKKELESLRTRAQTLQEEISKELEALEEKYQ